MERQAFLNVVPAPHPHVEQNPYVVTLVSAPGTPFPGRTKGV